MWKRRGVVLVLLSVFVFALGSPVWSQTSGGQPTPGIPPGRLPAPTGASQIPVSDSTSASTWKAVPDCDDSAGQHLNFDTTTKVFTCGTTGSGSGAPTDATYITQTANGSLSAEQALSSLSTGLMNVTTTTGQITSHVPTDDNLLMGNGTAWQLKAVPDCDDSAGQHLNYDTATNAWSCGTSGSGGVTGLSVNGDTSVNAGVALTWASATAPTFNSGGTTTCNLALSNVCLVTFSGGNTTLALSNPHGSGPYFLRSCQDGTGSRTYTFPASAKGFSQPDPTASLCTDQMFLYDGTNYLGQGASVPQSTAHGFSLPEGTAITCSAGNDCLYADATDHRFEVKYNGDTATALVTAASALTTNLPVIGAGTEKVAVGTRSGNTTKFVSMDASSPATNDCAKWDASGNLTTAGAACGAGGGSGTPGSTLFSSITDAGPSNTATETTLIGSVVGSTTIAANTFTDGALMMVKAEGYFSTPAVADSATLKAYCGATAIASASLTFAAGVLSNGSWEINLAITARGTGAAGTFMVNGLAAFSGSALAPTEVAITNPGGVSTVTAFDFTTSCAFDLKWKWNAAQSGETMKGSNVAVYFPGVPTTVVKTDQSNTYSTGTQSYASATAVIAKHSAGYAPTADASWGYDDTQDTYVFGGDQGVAKKFVGVLCALTGTSTVNADSGAQGTTETNFSTTCTIPANMLIANKTLRVTIGTQYTTSGSPPTLTFRLKYGTTVLAAQGPNAPTASLTGLGNSMIFFTMGTGGTLSNTSLETQYNGNAAAGMVIRNTVTQPVTGIDVTGSATLQLSAQWGTATTGNTITLRQLLVEVLN